MKGKVTKTIAHPLEDAFGIPSGTTEISKNVVSTEVTEHSEYDEKDDEIDTQLQEIADFATAGYQDFQDEIDKVEGKYKARMGEVAKQYLDVALTAIDRKLKLKEHKDKISVKKTVSAGKGAVTNNTLIVTGNRNDVLKQLLDDGVIDGEVIENQDGEASE